jgi:hypothetical protein
VDGRSFREIFEWKGASLWWMTESFLRNAPESPACVRLVETWLRILEAEAPHEVEAVGLPPRAEVLLERAATSRGVLFHGRRRAPSTRGRAFRSWLSSFGMRSSATAPGGTPEAWLEILVDPSAAPGDPSPEDTFARFPLDRVRSLASRPARKEEARARRRFRRSFGELGKSPGVHEAFSHRGIPFHDLALGDLALLLFDALPRAVRLFEDMTAILRSAPPRSVALLVPSRDERRTLLAACAAAGVPTVVLRSGEGDASERADGGPQPHLVLAWNGSASLEDLKEALREAARLRAPDARREEGSPEAPAADDRP